MTAGWLLLLCIAPPDLPLVVVDRDDVEITASCRVRVEASPLVDDEGDGVIRITADDVTVEFEGPPLRGAPAGRTPDAFEGVGVRVTGRGVTVRGARISGFKAGILARGADRLTVEDCDVSDNFRQRLGSTADAEDPADWLRPHDNDDNEWLTRYGAGVYVEESSFVTLRRLRARGTQNGIVLDRVSLSKVYDNDCSFGSGWGIALWRSSNNVISRNACDFRVRGYSHGVYNRGQDSAGILLFEQCSDNVVTHNSATHCGDGFFGFAGSEALGRTNPRPAAWHLQRGCNKNRIANNDFSDAAAHGLELTFSFGNKIIANRMAGNAICGVWGGYSQRTLIADNVIEANGDMPYGSERGGINIEHGWGNFLYRNTIRDNPCGVFMWWDRDPEILQLPWAEANPTASEENALVANVFERGEIGVQVRRVGPTTLAGNRMIDVPVEIDADEASEPVLVFMGDIDQTGLQVEPPEPVGETSPVGALDHLRGRRHIVMTTWGPYDWESPLLHRTARRAGRHEWALLGPEPLAEASLAAPEGVALTRDGARLTVQASRRGAALPYELTARTAGGELRVSGVLLPVDWRVTVFAWSVDPREDAETWRRLGVEEGRRVVLPALDLDYGGGGPSGLGLGPRVTEAALPADRFGTIAETAIALPAGRWRIRTTSDDGIRVWLDGKLVIDDWTRHPPRRHAHDLELDEPGTIEVRVEHFELDGYAILTLDVERAG